MFSWFKNAKKVAELEAKLNEERRLRQSADETANRAAKDSMATAERLQSAIRRAAEAEQKHREQNEADLLMMSLKISKRLLEGEKKDSGAMLGLLQQQANLQNSLPYGLYGSDPYVGAAQGLLGGIFGH